VCRADARRRTDTPEPLGRRRPLVVVHGQPPDGSPPRGEETGRLPRRIVVYLCTRTCHARTVSYVCGTITAQGHAPTAAPPKRSWRSPTETAAETSPSRATTSAGSMSYLSGSCHPVQCEYRIILPGPVAKSFCNVSIGMRCTALWKGSPCFFAARRCHCPPSPSPS
jgi:hypothetical protein